MKTRYNTNMHQFQAILAEEYEIKVDKMQFIPMGDSAYSYEMTDVNGNKYYLKLFDHQNDRQKNSLRRLISILPITQRFYDEGIFTNTARPIQNKLGWFTTVQEKFTIILFNFIEGSSLAEAYPFSKHILERLGKTMASIHKTVKYIEPGTALADSFDLSFEPELRKCLSMLENPHTMTENIKVLQEQVLTRKQKIISILTELPALCDREMKQNKNKVWCHGDLWGGNLIQRGKELYVIDWESACIAPAEFDLFNYLGSNFNILFTAYQKHMEQTIKLNPDLLRFYSYRHHLRNLTDWLKNILLRNSEKAQNENDLDMIAHHCLNRLDAIESSVAAVEKQPRSS